MPTHSELAHAVHVEGENLSQLRLRYMKALSAHTGRPIIAYVANPDSPTALVADDDLGAFMDVLCGISGPSLDLLIHSNGGSPDAADMLVAYLREKFDDLRVIVPRQAMSAATMIACGANRIVLARHSFLGPIDLQLRSGDGGIIAAQEVLDQYELIKQDFPDDPAEFWDGPGRQYFPTLLIRCQNALAYGREVVERHLREVMFAGSQDAAPRAKTIANDLGDHVKHKHHGRRLSRRYLKDIGLKIEDLEDDQKFQDLVLSVHHCMMLTFEQFPAISKIVQSHLGKFAPTFEPEAIAQAKLNVYKLRHALSQDGEDQEDDDCVDVDATPSA